MKRSHNKRDRRLSALKEEKAQLSRARASSTSNPELINKEPPQIHTCHEENLWQGMLLNIRSTWSLKHRLLVSWLRASV